MKVRIYKEWPKKAYACLDIHRHQTINLRSGQYNKAKVRSRADLHKFRIR